MSEGKEVGCVRCHNGWNYASTADVRKDRFVCSQCGWDSWSVSTKLPAEPETFRNPDEHHSPDHYRAKSIEPIDSIRSWLGDVAFVQYCRGQVIRYASRLGDKDESVKEARKLEVYARWMRETLESKELSK